MVELLTPQDIKDLRRINPAYLKDCLQALQGVFTPKGMNRPSDQALIKESAPPVSDLLFRKRYGRLFTPYLQANSLTSTSAVLIILPWMSSEEQSNIKYLYPNHRTWEQTRLYNDVKLAQNKTRNPSLQHQLAMMAIKTFIKQATGQVIIAGLKPDFRDHDKQQQIFIKWLFGEIYNNHRANNSNCKLRIESVLLENFETPYSSSVMILEDLKNYINGELERRLLPLLSVQNQQASVITFPFVKRAVV